MLVLGRGGNQTEKAQLRGHVPYTHKGRHLYTLKIEIRTDCRLCRSLPIPLFCTTFTDLGLDAASQSVENKQYLALDKTLQIAIYILRYEI